MHSLVWALRCRCGDWLPEQPELDWLRLAHPCTSLLAVFTATGGVLVPCVVCGSAAPYDATQQWARVIPRLTEPGLQPYAWTNSPQRCVQGSLRPAGCRRGSGAVHAGASPRLQGVLLGLCRCCRRERSRHSWWSPRGLTQAFSLQTVCRCAPHFET